MATRTVLFLAVLTLMVHLAAPAIGQTPTPTTSVPAQAAPTPTSASTPISAGQSAQAVAGAKALVLQIIHTKPNGFPPASIFTNRSAALMGVVMFIPLAFVDAFSSMGDAQQKAKGKKIDQAIKALGMKYTLGDNSSSMTPTQQKAVMDHLEKEGRPFYTDVIATFTKVTTEMPNDNSSKASVTDGSPSNQFPRDISAYTFTPVSPTEVKITAKDQKIPIEAKLEEGQWRLDLGGLADLNKWMPASKQASDTTANANVEISSDTPPPMKAAENIFFERKSSSDTQNGSEVLSFGDNYQWAVDDDILVERDGTTDNGRKMEIWLGKKADYYHILNTDLVAIRIHDKSYPRQDTFSDAIQGGDTERVREFIIADPKLANTKTDMDTPLQRAVFYDQKGVVQLLLHHGAKVDATDDFGQTALMDAAQFNKPDMVKLLLAAGANVNLKNDNGETALSIAKKAHFTDIVAILKQHEAK